MAQGEEKLVAPTFISTPACRAAGYAAPSGRNQKTLVVSWQGSCGLLRVKANACMDSGCPWSFIPDVRYFQKQRFSSGFVLCIRPCPILKKLCCDMVKERLASQLTTSSEMGIKGQTYTVSYNQKGLRDIHETLCWGLWPSVKSPQIVMRRRKMAE